MMDLQDYSDGSDDSDLDYKPPGEVENLSEIDSDDPIGDDDNYVANTSANKSKKTTKRKIKGKRSTKNKFKKIEMNDKIVEKTEEKDNIQLNSSEEDKKRLDSLWEEFQRPEIKKSTSNTSQNKSKLKETKKVSDKFETTKKRNVEDFFDTVDSSRKEESNDHKIIPVSSTTPVKKLSGGLSNILSQIGKKSKLTVLEKSKLDWDGYKQKEGIAEELVTYNKGKDGYLEKRDFLERTDLRQFELEKAMRDANRSRRN